MSRNLGATPPTAAPPAPELNGSGRQRHRRVAWVALGLLVAVATLAVVAARGEDGEPRRKASSTGSRPVAVSRRTLVERESVSGTLGFSGSRTVIHRLRTAGDGGDGDGSETDRGSSGSGESQAGAAGSGSAASDGGASGGNDAPRRDDEAGRSGAASTLTALAREGSVVRRGGVLYRVDGEPVVLMHGSTPAYRDLSTGTPDGPDVRQLESSLATLGFSPGTVDESFTQATRAAVERWQRAHGLETTGTVELGRVVFLRGARRIGERKAALGSVLSAGADVLDTTSTTRVVGIELDASKQGLATQGRRVKVTLPSGSVVGGRISRVGRVAREKSGSEGAGGGEGGDGGEQELVIDVAVRLRGVRGLGRLDQAPVSVQLATQARRRVLAVPVAALLARRGGGYGVETAGGRRVIPVKTGLFADGYVEIEGTGVREGMKVLMPGD